MMSQSSRIYVGHLDQRTRESDIEKFFKGFGRLREITMKSGFAFVEFEDYRDADDAVHELNGKELCGSRLLVEFTRGMPRGRNGAPHFDDYDRGGRGRGGGRGGFRGGYDSRPPYQQRSPRGGYGNDRGHGGGGGGGASARTPHRAVVENLSSSVSWQDLKDFMRQAGEVVFTDVFPKRNEGVVEFASATDLGNAMSKLDGKELNGRKIKLVEERYRKTDGDRSRRGRSRTRSRSPRSRSPRSRSRSASKSRSRSPPPKRTSRSKSRTRSPSSERRSMDDDKKNNDKKPIKRERRADTPEAASDEEKKPKTRRSNSSEKSD